MIGRWTRRKLRDSLCRMSAAGLVIDRDRKTKARILRRETTMPKIPENQDEEEKLKKGKRADVVKEEEKEEKDEDVSEEESEEDSSDDETPKANGNTMRAEPASSTAIPVSTGDDRLGRYQKILDARMGELQQAFAKGVSTVVCF